MQYIIILAISVLYLHADMEKITPAQHNAIHHYNFKPVLKLQEKSNMHRMHKIDELQAKKIVKDLTNEDVEELKLTHQSRTLFYKATTKNYVVKVNAMNGKIMQQEKKQ
jgi:uncharacterized membrane protein YkoI